MKRTLVNTLPVVLFFVIVNIAEGAWKGMPAVVIGLSVWMAVWWIMESVPIAVTSLLPIVILPVYGVLSVREVTANYGHHYIFLYLGGFILALAIEKTGLHKRMALNVLLKAGKSQSAIVLGFMLATAFLSMWVSNTATVIMMLPIAIAVAQQVNPMLQPDLKFGKTLMLAIAYAGSIGGMATLIGTVPNVIGAGVIKRMLNIELRFIDWMSFAFPISLLILILVWWFLTRVNANMAKKEIGAGMDVVQADLESLGKMQWDEIKVAMVFFATAGLWLLRPFLIDPFIEGVDDSMIAIGAAILLFLISSKERPGEKLMDWKTAESLPWGVLLLFGGGICLAEAFQVSGLTMLIGGSLEFIAGTPLFVALLILVLVINFMTELTSNIATVSMLLPVLAGLALSTDLHPMMLMLSTTLAASCAFMLPVATPPNAIVFSGGYLKVQDMVRAGLVLNLLSVILITVYMYLVVPILF
jgi:solute carrier family 13 (sodium-dependent dicarboxylate transporter), member 2/3/5